VPSTFSTVAGEWTTLDLSADPATNFKAVKDMLNDTGK
jgi:hypothetical protein